MQLNPQSDYFLCKKTNKNRETNQKLFFYSENEFPEYEIVKIPVKNDENEYAIGDVILSNSIPTKTKDGDNEYYLIKLENIIGKIR